ncbi:MAG TPA: sigma-54 dependent transcriptional regulator [bacterium]|nr:sigma-54 dependent transcriptional regulator [bacterium]
MRCRLLVVDDDPDILELFQEALGDDYDLITAVDGEQALLRFRDHQPQLMLLDVRLPKRDGIEVLRVIKEANPQMVVIMITANKDVSTAVQAMKLGAYDYLIKPFEIDHLKYLLERARDKFTLQREVTNLRSELRQVYKFDHIIGESRGMREVLATVSRVLDNEVPVLVLGESGTGKELIARAIHFNSRRSAERFVAVNCAAIPDNLIESELFGHERGAFTGATATKQGRFEMADRGTLFLDEIGSLKYELQAKLLRVLQEHSYERVGGTETLQTDVRIVAATGLDLTRAIAAGQFRDDLYYRLNVVPIVLPPLRERSDDIPLLVEHFLGELRRKLGRKQLRVSDRAMELLRRYHWPGNIRELENVVESTAILSEEDVIGPQQVQRRLASLGPAPELASGMDLDAVEKVVIQKTLGENRRNITRSAEVLGITRKTLRTKMKKYGII